MPRQFSMLKSAPYVVIPVCRAKQLQGEGVSHLNPFATIWCVIENILLAAAARRALIRGICRSAAGAYSRRAPIRSIRLFEPRAFYKSKKIVKRGRIPAGDAPVHVFDKAAAKRLFRPRSSGFGFSAAIKRLFRPPSGFAAKTYALFSLPSTSTILWRTISLTAARASPRYWRGSK